MLFYVQMRWNIEGRLTLDEVCDLQLKRAKQLLRQARSSACTRSPGSAA
jgi:hypothetical protein